MTGIIGVSLLLAVPLFALAASSGAGFETHSIFLSSASPTEGETVLVYVNVSNISMSAFQGSLVLKDSAAEIGTLPLSLSSGEARLMSVSWQPKAGTRTIVADINDTSGKTIATESATFSVTPKPVPVAASSAPNLAATVESSSGIQQSISQLSPQAGSVVHPVLSTLDNLRSATADILDAQIVQTKPKLPGGMVLGETTQTGATKPSDIMGWVSVVFLTIYFYILTIARAVVGSVALFYPILALLFVYLLYRLYRRTANPLY